MHTEEKDEMGYVGVYIRLTPGAVFRSLTSF
jgi:hypothetical protein